MMIFGFVFGLVIWLLVALVFGAVLGVCFRQLLRPLAIPKSAGLEYKRERLLCYLLFASFAFSTLAAVILGITYLIGFLRHLRRSSASAGTEQPESTRIIPRFVLSELLTMVFGLGVFPLVVQVLSHQRRHEDNKELAAIALYVGLAVFPACYLCALYRLNFHKVASGFRRSLLIVLTPYCALSVVSIALASFILLFSGLINVEPAFYIWVAACVAVVITTRILASQIAEESEVAKVRIWPNSPAPPAS